MTAIEKRILWFCDSLPFGRLIDTDKVNDEMESDLRALLSAHAKVKRENAAMRKALRNEDRSCELIESTDYILKKAGVSL